MSTLTFPRVVADLDGSGWPFYAARGISGVVWLATPNLVADVIWADEHEVRQHGATCEFTVLNEDVLTELLYTAPPAAGPHSRAELAQAVDGRLYAYRCRVEPRPEHNAPQQRAECRAWARELTGGAAL